MRKALSLAKKGLGRTHPNPPVGAVIVKSGRIIGMGFHHKAGEAHAEVEAIQNCSEKPKGATIYVTLEPCNHEGRTGACTQAILQAGIAEVFIGATDPNPDVQGSGANYLREHGVIVREELLEKECKEILRFFATSIQKKRPYIIYKAASSLDGKTATSLGESQWITSEAARRDVHKLRDQVDAILVGKHTFLKDNPRLTVRIPSKKIQNPLRLILNPDLSFPENCNLKNIHPLNQTVFLYDPKRVSEQQIKETTAFGFRVKALIKGTRSTVSDILSFLHEAGITSLLIEGGATTAWNFYQEKLIDEQVLYFAPKIIGGATAPGVISGEGFQQLATVPMLNNIEVKKIGCDVRITGKINYDI